MNENNSKLFSITKENLNSAIEEYFTTCIKMGLNIKPGQRVLIDGPVETYEYCRKLAKIAYECGAGDVLYGYIDSELSDLRLEKSTEDMLAHYPADMAARNSAYLDDNTVFLRIMSPNNFKSCDIDAKRLKIFTEASIKANKKQHDAVRQNRFVWSVVGIANRTWAAKMFPDMDSEDALLALWNALLTTCRVNGDGKSEQRWHEHIDTLHNRCKYLTDLNLASLHYKNSIGTDLNIELIDKSIWQGADTISANGHLYMPNLPTEEIYNLPYKYGVNGTVVASKTLLLRDTEVNGLRFEIKDGKIVNEYADTGLDTLKHYLDIDAGARYIGEVALVPIDSIISNLGLLFYNTLYDENAACHLAFGFAFPECVDGACDMSPEELENAGINFSNTHVDFMVGTPDLSIEGKTRDGKVVPIFTNGNFAF